MIDKNSIRWQSVNSNLVFKSEPFEVPGINATFVIYENWKTGARTLVMEAPCGRRFISKVWFYSILDILVVLDYFAAHGKFQPDIEEAGWFQV